jgi:putative phosphoesterase
LVKEKMNIFLVSDNHGWYDDAVLKHAATADEVWHAGDWLNLDLFHQLVNLGKPIRSCWGNVDGQDVRQIFPEHNKFTVEGVTVWLTHIAGKPGNYNPKIKAQLFADPPKLLVCGHSHILKVERDTALKNMIYVNPGSGGIQGFHLVRTALRFQLLAGKILNMEVIEFGPRVQKISV